MKDFFYQNQYNLILNTIFEHQFKIYQQQNNPNSKNFSIFQKWHKKKQMSIMHQKPSLKIAQHLIKLDNRGKKYIYITQMSQKSKRHRYTFINIQLLYNMLILQREFYNSC